MNENQFDTNYHEYFSYLSFLTAEKIFAAHGSTLYDVEELTNPRWIGPASRRVVRSNLVVTGDG